MKKEKFKCLIREENGITLVALVVTIIVMLILAGIGYGTFYGKDGLITKGEEIKNSIELQTNEEEKKIQELISKNAKERAIKVIITPETSRNTIKTQIQNGVETGPIRAIISYGEVKYTNNDKYQYRINGGEWKIANENRIDITDVVKNETIEVRYVYYEENIQKQEKYKLYEVSNVDNISPVIEEVTTKATTNKIIVTTTASDKADIGASVGIAGIAGYKYRILNEDGTIYHNWKVEETGETYDEWSKIIKDRIITINKLEQATKKKIEVIAVDKAGNESEIKTVEKVTLEIPKNISFEQNITEWTKENVKVTIKYNDNLEYLGLTRQYSLDGQTWYDCDEKIKVVEMTSNGKIYARYIDEDKQKGESVIHEVKNIDKIVPQIATIEQGENINIAFETNGGNFTTRPSTRVNVIGGIITEIRYRWVEGETYLSSYQNFTTEDSNKINNGQILTIGGEGNWYLWIYAKNSVGIETIQRSNIFKFNYIRVDGAIIPDGFYYVGGTKDTGIVISDVTGDDLNNTKKGNQFVWIPVTNESFLKRTEWNGNNPTNTIASNYTEPYANGYNTEIEEYNIMKEQVLKCGGFYIGRYEAGVNTTTLRTGVTNAQTVVVKKGVAPYSYVPWGKAMNDASQITGQSGAVYLAKNLAIQNSYTSVVSTLCYGVQWDAMCRFIGDSSRTTPIKAVDGLTGSVSTDVSKNIYDLAGNLYEWTMEASNTNIRILRGGSYIGTSSITYRGNAGYAGINGSFGFRISLYIK